MLHPVPIFQVLGKITHLSAATVWEDKNLAHRKGVR